MCDVLLFISDQLDKIFGFILLEYLMWRLYTGRRVLSWRYMCIELISVCRLALKWALLKFLLFVSNVKVDWQIAEVVQKK